MNTIELMRPYDITEFTRYRLGRNTDGGYIVPHELLSNISYCITYGVADDVSFEADLAKINSNCQFLFYDPTVKMLPNNAPQNSTFFKTWISNSTDETHITPHDTIKQVPEDAKILLKCDIEGAEYRSIETLNSNDIAKIEFLLIEIHWILRSDLKQKCHNLLEFLSKNFTCFHTHGNTHGGQSMLDGKMIPNVYELTYINNKLVKNKTPYIGPLPIPNLDFTNCQYKKDYDLSFLI